MVTSVVSSIKRQKFTVGDTLKFPNAVLNDQNDAVVDVSGKTIKFRMVNAEDHTTKINDATAAFVNTGTDGQVKYEWSGSEVDTPGFFFAWFIVEDASKQEHYPADRSYLIEIWPEDGTDIQE